MVDRFEKFSFTISEISRYWHQIASEEMNKYGLKGPHAVYFTVMYRYPEGITAVKLSELCSRDKADVSRAMSLFEKKGLITKKSDKPNFYRADLMLTQKGKEIAEYINSKAKSAVEIGGNGITEQERQVFYTTLEIICGNLKKLAGEIND